MRQKLVQAQLAKLSLATIFGLTKILQAHGLIALAAMSLAPVSVTIMTQ
jgi:hypothetical protein